MKDNKNERGYSEGLDGRMDNWTGTVLSSGEFEIRKFQTVMINNIHNIEILVCFKLIELWLSQEYPTYDHLNSSFQTTTLLRFLPLSGLTLGRVTNRYLYYCQSLWHNDMIKPFKSSNQNSIKTSWGSLSPVSSAGLWCRPYFSGNNVNWKSLQSLIFFLNKHFEKFTKYLRWQSWPKKDNFSLMV